ncbi:hypothetical protein [Nocardioides alkalitolerans]|uniref:hypothetical protein n=1 Tax=Nocardioides alkalitolerans TaxID=281714 RepID=UPI00040417CB|nr:hypothetical protein [Nocardioides alkalitolerans]
MSNYAPQPTRSSSARTMSIIGIVLGVIGFILFPIIAAIGAVLGFVAYAKGDRPLGMYVGIGCIVAGVAGFIIGQAILNSMN